MPHINSNGRKPATTTATVVLAFLLACLGLAACGETSKSSSSATNASASAAHPSGGSTGTNGSAAPGGGKGATGSGGAGSGGAGSGATGPSATGPGVARFRALRECLQKNGITLPKRTPGQRRPGGPGGPGGFLGGGAGGPQLPSGVTRAQYEAALKKCGGGTFAGRGARLKSPVYQAALSKFATCMRENGIDVPTPNTSGNGPVFSTKGIDTTSAKFRAAETKCAGVLRSTLRTGPRPGAAPPGGAPPSEAPPG